MKVQNWWRALAVALLCLLGSGPAGGAVPEYELKAAFVYNFAKFVAWPPGALKPESEFLILGILDEDPEQAAFDALTGKKAQGRTLLVQKGKMADLKKCHLVFVSAGAHHLLKQALDTLQGLPVLTVTDEVEDPSGQGIINLVTSGGRVRFQVNVRQARRLGFKISSQLLQLAVHVNE
jgi:hypothetical protein|uniref:YfiR family protein n=1 Tax=Desulfobacca acetoxidans TaxID=60893 RepID=A0A7C5ELL7_9BACT